MKMPVPEDLDPPPGTLPPYTNLETGQEVLLTEPHWNYNADLSLRRILCNTYDWDEAEGHYTHQPLNDFLKFDYVFHPRVGDTVRVTSVYTDVTVSIRDEVLTIDKDGSLPFREGLGRVEIVDQAVRIWQSNTRYRQCTSVKLLGAADVNTYIWDFPNAYRPNFFESSGYPDDDRVGFAPTGTTPDSQSTGACDYSSALVNDGWGWNPIAGVSCPPVDSATAHTTQDKCDYTDAEANDGWGWNPIAGKSCPPVDSPATQTTDDCNYTDAEVNGGWGWNPIAGKSCPPLAIAATQTTIVSCDYTDAEVNDGWGWNPETGESCAPID
ncbi:MAG: hypothetical protein AAF404_11205 [Pseudomonadota bacterium]